MILFLESLDVEQEVIGKTTKEVFLRYDTFCSENGFSRMAMQTFTKEVKKHLHCDRRQMREGETRVTRFVR